ncbi:MAG: GNAT family N-acetyltransferase [Pseudomonadota bacterium]
MLTPRLVLRRWVAEDAAALPAILGDAEVMAYSDHGPLDIAAQAKWHADAMSGAGEDSPGCGVWAAQERASGAVIGYVSLKAAPERLGPDHWELGFRFARRSWGRGLATEAVRAVIGAAGDTEVVAIVDPDNSASVALLKKLGGVRQRDVMLEGYDHPDHLYALRRGPP